MKNKISKLLIVIIFFIVILPFNVFAENLTKEDLSKAFDNIKNMCSSEKMKELMANDESIKCDSTGTTFNVDDTKITITSAGKTDTINYIINSDGTISFSSDKSVKKGMTEEEYNASKDGMGAVIYGFVAVANARGVSVEDSTAYMLESIILSAMSSLGEAKKTGYMIISDDVEVTSEDGTILIKKSEVPNRILEIAELDFKDSQPLIDKIEDGTEAFGINSYKLTNSFTKNDENTGTINYTLLVDSNADYSKINGSFDNLMKMFDNIGNDLDDATHNSLDPNPPQQQEEEPNADTSILVSKYSILILVGLLALIIAFKKKRYFYKI